MQADVCYENISLFELYLNKVRYQQHSLLKNILVFYENKKICDTLKKFLRSYFYGNSIKISTFMKENKELFSIKKYTGTFYVNIKI